MRTYPSIRRMVDSHSISFSEREREREDENRRMCVSEWGGNVAAVNSSTTRIKPIIVRLLLFSYEADCVKTANVDVDRWPYSSSYSRGWTPSIRVQWRQQERERERKKQTRKTMIYHDGI